MKSIAVIQARSSSTRLPGKVLKPILERPMILRQLERIRRARRIDDWVLATSTDASDDALTEVVRSAGVRVYRGSLDDVLARFVGAVADSDATHVVRLTGDCPLADPEIIDSVIARAAEGGADYVSNTLQPTYPDGLDVEVCRRTALLRASAVAQLRSEREHVTPYLYKHPELFALESIVNDVDLSAERWTVDEPRDFEFVSRIYGELYPRNPAFGWREVLSLLSAQPQLRSINTGIQRNEGYQKSLKQDSQ